MDEVPASQTPSPAVPPPAPPAVEVPAATAAKPKKVKDESWWGTLRFLLYLFIAAVLIRTFIFAPFSIPSASMLPNLQIGDYLFVAKWPYGYSRYSIPFHPIPFDGRVPGGVPARGDVIVFRHPGPDNEDYVKRVIGLPGDTIEVRSGEVILNGRPLRRERMEDFVLPVSPNSPCQVQGQMREEGGANGQNCIYPRYREFLPDGRGYEILNKTDTWEGDTFGPITVPAGHLFVMGDNRDDSMDSRFPIERRGVGLLPIENVLGRALIGFWSTDGSAQWLLPWTWFTAARWSRIFETY